jgi:hypothetical protein
MAVALFEARWNRIRRSREQGYEELTDFLGRHAGLGAMVRLGLLRRREHNEEFQRYNGYVPTAAGAEYLLYVPEKELILVLPGKSAPLFLELQNDPAPKSPFKATYAEPTASQFELVNELKDTAGRDVWRVQRAEQLREHLLMGYMDFRTFTKRHGVGEGSLLNLGLCTPRTERPHERALSLEPTEEGATYLYMPDPWELLLVKPGMELPLFARCEPEQADYWCHLP